MRSIGADAATIAAGIAYLRWFMPGLALQFALVAMGSALRGTGIVKPTMIVQVLALLLNIVLAPVLIAGWGTGRPARRRRRRPRELASRWRPPSLLMGSYFARLETLRRVRLVRSGGRSLAVWKRMLAHRPARRAASSR